MKFYYTGAIKFGDPQISPIKSVGGFISNSVVPNNFLANLFVDTITPFTVDRDLDCVIGIALKNELGFNITNLKLWFDFPIDNLSKMEVGFQTPGGDATNGFYLEKIQAEPNRNSKASPYSTTFYEAKTEPNALVIGNLAKDAYLGIWLKRTIDQTAYFTQQESAYIDTNPTPNTKETVELKLSWLP